LGDYAGIFMSGGPRGGTIMTRKTMTRQNAGKSSEILHASRTDEKKEGAIHLFPWAWARGGKYKRPSPHDGRKREKVAEERGGVCSYRRAKQKESIGSREQEKTIIEDTYRAREIDDSYVLGKDAFGGGEGNGRRVRGKGITKVIIALKKARRNSSTSWNLIERKKREGAD